MMRENLSRAPLLCDLWRVAKERAWREHRVDVFGFLGAWLLVAVMIGLYYWLSTWNR